MALVQYDVGSSDSSDTENESSETINVTKSIELPSTAAPQKGSLKKKKDNEDDKKAQVGKKIKIAIPKITDDTFDEHDADEIIPKVLSKADPNETSGLLTKLPAPKNVHTKRITTTSFVPHTLTRKSAPNPQSKINKAKLLAAKAKEKATNKSKADDLASILRDVNDKSDDDDDDDDITSISTSFDEDIWSQICGRPKKQRIEKPTIPKPPTITENITIAPEQTEKPCLKLDNIAFKQLVGSTKRRQQILPNDVTITDIVESDILQKTDVWMRKALTDPQYQQKNTEESETTNPVAKNKHHITFLAQQAKAKEQELQAQWASGNQKRQMSRAKYGF